MSTFYAYPTKEQEEKLRAFLAGLDIPFTRYDEEVPAHIVDGISTDQEDTASDVL